MGRVTRKVRAVAGKLVQVRLVDVIKLPWIALRWAIKTILRISLLNLILLPWQALKLGWRALKFLWRPLTGTTRQVTVGRLLALAAVVGLVYGGLKIQLPLIVRDLTIATYAHIRAGAPIPFSPDYTYSQEVVPSDELWGTSTNSTWLADNVRLITPFFAYDNLAKNPRAPATAIFVPFGREKSFNVAGQALVIDDMIVVNEREIYDQLWNDEAEVLEVLTHELIHMQGGIFLKGTPPEFESATSAATTEILAGMCNAGDSVSCKAFWAQVAAHGRSGLMYRLPNWLYDFIAVQIWRDADHDRLDRRQDRFWAGREADRLDIIYRYGVNPWEYWIIPGLNGHSMSTEITYLKVVNEGDSGVTHYEVASSYMAFDDTFDLLGWPMADFIRLLSTIKLAGS